MTESSTSTHTPTHLPIAEHVDAAGGGAANASADATAGTTSDATTTDATTTDATTTDAAEPTAAAPAEPAEPGVVSEDQVKLALRRVKDPDLSINIIDLGLVYGIAVSGTTVSVDMTLTSPGCPSGPEIMGDAERELKTLPGVENVAVNLVWSPFWTPDKMEPRVRTYMGF